MLGQSSCDQCQGKGSIYIEGDIYKKQKKGGSLKKYWFVLPGKELYSYKAKGDAKHKGMKSMAGVYLKDEPDAPNEHGENMYLFMLNFPNKRSIYYLKSKEEKEKWINGIKEAVGYSSFNDFYDLTATLGQGKYGVVK